MPEHKTITKDPVTGAAEQKRPSADPAEPTPQTAFPTIFLVILAVFAALVIIAVLFFR